MRSFPLLLVLLSTPALALPVALHHQGRLLDATGLPLDGAHDLALALYADASGGTALWSATYAGVDFDQGYFSVQLGADDAPIDGALLARDTLWLGLAVGTGAELPRLPIGAVPYARHADTSTHVDGGTVDATVLRVNGVTVADASGVSYGALPVGQAPGTVAAGDDSRFDTLAAGLAQTLSADEIAATYETIAHAEATWLPAADASDFLTKIDAATTYAAAPTGGGFSGTFWIEVEDPEGDPISEKTVLLLDFEDALTDRSAVGHTVTKSGSATVVSDAKFGEGAIRFGDGGKGKLEVPWHDSFKIGASEDFTLDWWVKYDAAETGGGCHRVFQWGNNLANGFHVFYCSASENVGIGVSGVTQVGTPVAPLRGTGWHHFAVVRSSGTVTVYVDGLAKASGSWTRENNTGTTLYFSAYPGTPDSATNYWMHGNLDNVRFTVGEAMWKGDFSPPGEIGSLIERKQVTVKDGMVISIE